MTETPSLVEQLVRTARQKAEAARARSQPAGDDEKPKDVILAVCQKIADDLSKDGFTFQKSTRGLRKDQGDLSFRIYFQSDRNNIAGRRAAVWIHAGVHSKKLRAWRRDHPMPWGGNTGPDGGLVTGGQIGNLLPQPTWMDWNFAIPRERDKEVEDAISAIRRIILPIFAQFDDPAAALRNLADHALLWRASMLQYAFVALGPPAAEVAGRLFLERHPAIRKQYDESFVLFSASGLPAFVRNVGSDLAAVAVATRLDLSR